MKAIKQHSGFSVRRPRAGSAKGPEADIRAEVVSRHRNSRAALVSLRAHPRTEEGYSNCFIFDEKQQRRLSNYEADKI